MNDSMAQEGSALAPLDLPGWKNGLSWLSAILLGGLFLASGLWKINDVQGTAVRMVQAKVPGAFGLPAAFFFGIVETVGAGGMDPESPACGAGAPSFWPASCSPSWDISPSITTRCAARIAAAFRG